MCYGALNTECLTCADEFVYNVTTRECDACKPGCALCDFDDKTLCTKCASGYY